MKILLVFAIGLCLLMGCSTTHYNTPERIRNFEQVSTNLYRSGQIEYITQWQYVTNLGIFKAVKLNTVKEYDDSVAADYGVKIINVPLPPSNFWQLLSQPEEEQYFRALWIVKQSINNNEKILVYCKHGEDRTSLVIAGAEMYILKNKNKEEAYKDMKDHNFHVFCFGLNNFFFNLEDSPSYLK